jgi:hypothetical protein
VKPSVAVAMAVVALAPSAYIAWRAREGPHLGFLHDDALYWVCAQSLAAGQGYRISSLPGQPHQTKYPPLYPLLLSAVWRADPVFPRNLRLAHLLAWTMVPLYVAAAGLAYVVLWGGASAPRAGLSACSGELPPAGPFLFCMVVAVNPFVALAGASLLSELPFSVLLMLALALVERARDPRRPAWLAMAAGTAASAAFLTRSVGLVLLLAAPLAFAARRQFDRAALFAMTMLPAVAGWFAWAHLHRSATTPAYYTDYLGYYWRDIAAADLPGMAWRNFDSLFASLGSLVVFNLGDGSAGRSVAWVLAAAALAGVLRLARAGLNSFHLFTALYLPVLVFWNYMPDQRFLLPVFPVLLAGLVAELRNLARTIPAGAPTRVAQAVAAVCLAGVAWQTAFAFRTVLPVFLERHRAGRERLAAMYDWSRTALPPQATVFAYRDPLMWLYTGRRSERLVVPPSLLYRGDRGGLARLAESAGDYARARGLSHALFTAADLDAELAGEDRTAAQRRMRAGARFKLLHEAGGAALYAVQ